jgi:ABC-type dipeptide/oligopeptide/nickel transport system permease component
MQTSPNIQAKSTSKERKPNSALVIGFILIVGSVLTLFLLQLLFGNQGDTTETWIAGFVDLFLGIPLFILGIALLVIGVITYGKRDK